MIFLNFISFFVGMMFLKEKNGDKVSDIYTHMVYIGNKTSPIRSLSYISIYSHTSILSYSLNVLNMESGSAHQREQPSLRTNTAGPVR